MKRKVNWGQWKRTVDSFRRNGRPVRIAMVGKYASLADSYISVNQALLHAAVQHHATPQVTWIEAEEFEDGGVGRLSDFDGIVIPQGFGKRGAEGKIRAADFAREKNIPFLGLCFGFQMATVAFARSVLGWEDANSTEIDPNTNHPVVDLLPEQKGVRELGATMRLGGHDINIDPGTAARKIYRSRVIRRRHRHRYEINPEMQMIFKKSGMVFSAHSDDGRRMEILEYPKNSFYMGTQYHPEYNSRPGKPEQIFSAFIAAALG